jgi:hypothetical protein
METSHCGGSYLPLVLEGRLRAELLRPAPRSRRTFGGWVLWPVFLRVRISLFARRRIPLAEGGTVWVSAHAFRYSRPGIRVGQTEGIIIKEKALFRACRGLRCHLGLDSKAVRLEKRCTAQRATLLVLFAILTKWTTSYSFI